MVYCTYSDTITSDTVVTMSWNRTYRPQKVAQLHLSTVRDQLLRLLEEGRLPQTMLFAGPKGTGKTSTSRILGAVLNDPVNAAAVETVFFGSKSTNNPRFQDVTSDEPLIHSILHGSSFVVQEMDAASNRGIDDIRQLKERVMLPPQQGLMTVYILDEAHMLTTEAFNALLKLLEEPPQHVLFILATTELHKIPATIVSRCQVIQFRKATDQELLDALSSVLKAENVSASKEALQALVQKADGSFRDVIKLAELATHDQTLDLSHIQSTVFGNLDSEIEQLLQHIMQKDTAAVLLQFEQFRSRQVEATFLHKRLLEILHNSLLAAHEISDSKTVVPVEVAQYLLLHLSDHMLSQPSPLPHLPLELKILSIIQKAQRGSTKKAATPSKPFTTTKVKTAAASILPPATLVSESITTTKVQDASKLQTHWAEFIATVKELSAPIAVLLQSTQLVATKQQAATVKVYYEFHYERLTETASQTVIHAALEEFLGGQYQLDFQLASSESKPVLTKKVAAQALL